jgi:Predicted exonuclease of the beta-lactamase fold involved in RNA processing
LLIGESTYGERQDLKIREKERKNDLDKLKSIIDMQVLTMHGKLIIPVFAQSRCPSILTMIYQLYCNENFPYKVYIDSPLAIKLLYDYRDVLEGEEKELFEKILNWDNLVLVEETIDSKALVADNSPKIVLSTSGMCQIGRIRHHFKSVISNPNATILFCGYSTEGSLASLLKDPKRKEIDIDGKTYVIRCCSQSLKSMSGHATFEVLLDYYSHINCNKIILHHGNTEAKENLSKELKKKLEKECKTTKVICANNSLKFTL